MFDRYVQGTKPSWKRRSLATISVALHVIAGVALAIYSIIHVEEISPPALSLTFFSAPPPPPPPPPPAAKKQHVERKPVTKMVQPSTVPKLVQPKTEPEPEPEADDSGGVEGGVEGGVKGGVVGGVLGAAPPPPTVKPKNVPPHALDAQALYKPDPHLPDIVKSQHGGGGELTFTGKVCVDQGGKVFQVNVLAGIPGADRDIIATIREWKFKPQPIPVCFLANWVFTIK